MAVGCGGEYWTVVAQGERIAFGTWENRRREAVWDNSQVEHTEDDHASFANIYAIGRWTGTHGCEKAFHQQRIAAFCSLQSRLEHCSL
jgi:hypothetical protein